MHGAPAGALVRRLGVPGLGRQGQHLHGRRHNRAIRLAGSRVQEQKHPLNSARTAAFRLPQDRWRHTLRGKFSAPFVGLRGQAQGADNRRVGARELASPRRRHCSLMQPWVMPGRHITRARDHRVAGGGSRAKASPCLGGRTAGGSLEAGRSGRRYENAGRPSRNTRWQVTPVG
jgi:hypothetical protein